jgi:aminopeptidase N
MAHAPTPDEKPFSRPGSTAHYGPDRPVRVRHIALDVRPDLAKKRIDAIATLTVEAIVDGVASIELDAVDLDVLVVHANHTPLAFTSRARTLDVAFAEPLRAGETTTFSIAYAVISPRRGVYFPEPDAGTPEKPRQLWTQCQASDARYWVPCQDEPDVKQSTRTTIVVPKPLFALGNGALLERRDDGETTTFVYEQTIPHSAYLLTLVVGEFDEVEQSGADVPVAYYVAKGRIEEGARSFGDTPEMVRVLADFTGTPYPFARYGQIAVADFMVGGMENTTATTQTDLTLHDARAALDYRSDGLVSHELAHQWFGDLLTTRDWSHAWLNEGFATYCECVWWEAKFGWDEYVNYVAEAVAAYLAEESDKYRRAIVENVYRDPSELFDRHLYKKGGAVLHMVRGTLGHEPFRASIARYVRDNAGRSVETIDLVRAIEAATGRNLRELFDRYVLAPGHPTIAYAYRYDTREKAAIVTISQTQTIDDANPAFTFDVVIGVVADLPDTIATDAGDGPIPGEQRVRVHVDRAETTVTIPLDVEPALVRVDPGAYVLGDVSFALGTDMHVAILRAEPDVVARSRAARALGKDASRRAFDALETALRDDPFWGVGVQVAKALASTHAPRARDILIAARTHAHPKMRRAIASALGTFASTDATLAALTQLSSDESYFVIAEALASIGRSRAPGAFELLRAQLETPSWQDTIAGGALRGLAELGDERAVSLVVACAANDRPAWLREAALAVIPRLYATLDRQPSVLVDTIVRALDDPLHDIRRIAMTAAGRMGDPAARPLLARVADDRSEGFLQRIAADAVADIDRAQRTPAELDRLQRDIDELRSEVAHLRALSERA